MQISLEEARARIVFAQGLGSEGNRFGAGKDGTLAALEHLSYVQIDTISVVERAHHHVLHTRVGDYQPRFLHELVSKDKTAFEYWSHAAAFLPMTDYRFSLLRKKRYADGLAHWFVPTREHKKQRKIILERLRAEGPLQIKDFERPTGAKTGWFEHTPAKQMFEQLFMEGVVMIRERKGFHKIYDLTERVLPSHVNTDLPTDEENAMYLIRAGLKTLSLANYKELSYARRLYFKTPIKKALQKMLKSGEISPIQVEGLDSDYYTFTENLNHTPEFAPINTVQVLSPFDSFVIQRQRMQNFFDFNYQIECYVPEPKRKYGYFALPLLYRNQLIGLIDAKAHRGRKLFKVNSVFLRRHFRDDSGFREKLKMDLENFSLFNGCEKISLPKRFLLY